MCFTSVYIRAFCSSAQIVLICLIGCGNLLSQDTLKPQFTPFEGSVYHLPVDSVPKGYRPYVEYLAPLKYITWDSLFVPGTPSKEPFPDVNYKILFGIIFYSQMTIPEDGMYEFILVSDDGSRLWIDDRSVINNDLPHGMRIKRDTIPLRQGEHKVKIWYYQAYPTWYGLMFASNYMGPAEFDDVQDSITWDGDILFDFDQYILSTEGEQLLDSLIDVIEELNVSEITILGHTDDTGDLSYNYELSKKRANAIKDKLSKLDLTGKLEFTAVGHGEMMPRVPNDSSINRAKNRRVEFVLY